MYITASHAIIHFCLFFLTIFILRNSEISLRVNVSNVLMTRIKLTVFPLMTHLRTFVVFRMMFALLHIVNHMMIVTGMGIYRKTKLSPGRLLLWSVCVNTLNT